MPVHWSGLFKPFCYPAHTFALAIMLFLAIACTGDRPTETGLGEGFQASVSAISCTNGCKDTFTDADGNPLSAHVPDLGGFTWSRMTDYSDYIAEIRGNAVGAEHTDSSDKQWLYIVPEITGLDTVEAEVELLPSVEIGFGRMLHVLIVLRNNGTTYLSGYGVWLHIQAAAARAFVEFTRNAESLPPASSIREIPWPGPGILTFRAEASAGVLKAYVNGVLVNSVTDPSPLPPGHPGLGFSTNIFPAASDVTITSFEVRPCPLSGDSLLDSKAMRDLLTMAWDSSNAFDPNKLSRRERGGYLFRDASGKLAFAKTFSVNDMPCSSPNLLPPDVPPASVVAEVHTHPFSGDTLGTGRGEETTGICSPAIPGTKKFYDAATYGGPSRGDLDRGTNDNLPMYIMDKDNIYSFPPGTTTSNWKTQVKKYPRTDPRGCTRP